MKQEKSAGAVLFIKGKEIKYLLLHYEAKHWDFPKGHIEKNETDEQTVKREVAEETGIRGIKLIKGFNERVQYYYKLKCETINKTVNFYIARANTEKVTISFEHIGFAWLTYKKAMEKLTYNNAKEILEKANNFLRTHKTLEDFY